ncbi:MAG: FAD-dependent oxidoreductase [Alphaproteobacteria bacterium]|nr:FAD-dependent oxidoreductase [Alphaproteobacteria bacterium]
MSKLFPNLFSPLKLRHLTLKHRMVFGTHTANMSVERRPGERHLAYYRARARGGAAMIVIEPIPAHRTGLLTRGQFSMAEPGMVPYFRRITEMCHAEGVVVSQQVFHIGAHCDPDNSFQPNWSPSGTASFRDGDGSHAMTGAEVEELLESYVYSAGLIRECGYDGIEINAGYNSLIDSFWSPLTNRRDDRWGGNLEGRMRFPVELLSRVRKKVGENFLIGLTISGDDNMPGGLDVAARQEIVAYLDSRGLVDYFPIKTGSYYDWARVMPSFMLEDLQGPPLAAAMKQVVRHARIQAESRIKTPANAERVIAEGQADMVSLVRGQIADPQLARKASEDRPQDIRPCISCNQLCVGRRGRDYWFSCLVNPSVGREYQWGTEPFPAGPRSRRIVVVGAGPGGLETARVAAERGHKVTLVEAEDRIGGQFRLAGTQPRRGEIAQLLVFFYQSQLDRLGVELRLNTRIDAEGVRALAPGAVVLATGSVPPMTGFQRAVPGRARMPGIDKPNVFSINEVLLGSDRVGQRVLLLDDLNGWMPASGTALYLAQRGHQVTVVTSAAATAQSLASSTADGPMHEWFAEHGIEQLTASVVDAWSGQAATIRSLLDGTRRNVSFDALVLATTNVPDQGLHASLQGSGLELHQIGDCVAARTAAMAIYEGAKLAREL